MGAREIEEASFEEHRAWLTDCSQVDALDAASESTVGVPNTEEALDRARDLADQPESQAARSRGIVRARGQVPTGHMS